MSQDIYISNSNYEIGRQISKKKIIFLITRRIIKVWTVWSLSTVVETKFLRVSHTTPSLFEQLCSNTVSRPLRCCLQRYSTASSGPFTYWVRRTFSTLRRHLPSLLQLWPRNSFFTSNTFSSVYLFNIHLPSYTGYSSTDLFTRRYFHIICLLTVRTTLHLVLNLLSVTFSLRL